MSATLNLLAGAPFMIAMIFENVIEQIELRAVLYKAYDGKCEDDRRRAIIDV